ncbi:MAG: DUF4214 domain-containing protein [Verrucomicrobia bacterium]|nr:DUF4214 domain-containing protein [Verrucomicrobiota bacterium]
MAEPVMAAKRLTGVVGRAARIALRSKSESQLVIYSRFTYRVVVSALYKAAFGRQPDKAGLAGNVARLQAGTPLEVVAEDLVRSEEFQMRHGPDPRVDRKYLTALYRDGLGREPDPEGLAYWLAEGEKGATPAKVLAGLAASDEALEKALSRSTGSTDQSQDKEPALLVRALYKTAFGRPVDEAGLAANVARLQTGTPLEALAHDLTRSAEFQARHGSKQDLDLEYLSALYRDGLGRQPDPDGLAFWMAEAEKGVTRAQALAAFAASGEATRTTIELPGSPSGKESAYDHWVAAYDSINDEDRAAIRAHLAGLPFRPLISIVVVPSGRRLAKAALEESLNSVLAQLYPCWELWVAVAAGSATLVTEILGAASRRDPRVRTVSIQQGSEDGAAAVNAAVKSVTGEFVAFLRSGDILPEHALYEVAVELGANARPDVVYTDQDRIDAKQRRSDPWFKPGWDPDLLLAQDYLSHLVVYRRAVVEDAGFLRAGFEGAEYYDLALRVTAAITPDRIRHVPAILYHRRTDNDDAIRPDNGLSALRTIASSRRAVRDHLDSHGYTNAVVKPAPQMPSATRVIWPLPDDPPLVSVIIPTRDRWELLAHCVDGVLHRTEYPNLELLIVNNESTDPATHALFGRLVHQDRRVRIVHCPGPFNYSALNNTAAREATGEVLVLLNNDVWVIDSGWLRELVSHALRPDVGAVGAKLLYPNEQVQHGGIILGGPQDLAVHAHRCAARNDPGYFGQLALTRTLSAVTGACLAIRRMVFLEVGGLDEVNLKVAYNDVDLCLRLGDYGYRVVWTPFAELFHLESASRGKDDTLAKQELFRREVEQMRRRWGSLLRSSDPFHNPNLLFSWDGLEVPSVPRRPRPWNHVSR